MRYGDVGDAVEARIVDDNGDGAGAGGGSHGDVGE